MAISVNKVMLVGRLGADPEQRRGDVVTLRLATSESWRDKNSGERQERTQWHNVVIFNEVTARFVANFAKKGDLLYVEGQLETRKWEREGQEDKYYTEVVIRPYSGSVQIMSKGMLDAAEPEERTTIRRDPHEPPLKNTRSTRLDDDEIPF